VFYEQTAQLQEQAAQIQNVTRSLNEQIRTANGFEQSVTLNPGVQTLHAGALQLLSVVILRYSGLRSLDP
jgi:hypothetical protein